MANEYCQTHAWHFSDDHCYKVIGALEANPAISQRELARELDLNLGKLNCCVQALVEKGMVKPEIARISMYSYNERYRELRSDCCYVPAAKNGRE